MRTPRQRFRGDEQNRGRPPPPPLRRTACRWRNTAPGGRLSGCDTCPFGRRLVTALGTMVTVREKDRQERLAIIGRTLCTGVKVPTDTYIAGDIPLLLTRLSQIPALPGDDRRR